MNSIAFPKITSSSGLKHFSITKLLLAKTKAFFNSAFVKLLLVLAVGAAAWLSWKPSLFDLYKVEHHVVVAALAKENADEFKRAAWYFKQRNYHAAEKAVAKYYENNLDNAAVVNKYAMILIAGNDLKTAKKVLYPNYLIGDTETKSLSAYLLALIFLKEGQNYESKKWLQKLSINTTYYQQSRELIATLESKTAK